MKKLLLALLVVAPLANASNFPSYIEFECDNFTYWGNARKEVEIKWVKVGWDVENTEAQEMTTYYHLPTGDKLLNVDGQKDWQSFIGHSPVMLLNCKITKEKSNW
ncbi:hypothetical protein [Vibrio sp. B181a]|uniref:hypothetical protein n=1 Tax=Vibrio sp. B181a TaxID=2835906 RepID=UPI002557611B|nr:hypothetical protein [Vibrio sp. B181a]MDK9774694.1 hypothetical protein [Vibrio sp. B181a]